MSLTIIVGVSALFGISEAIKQTQSKARRDEHRSRKCHLLVHCSKSSQYSPILEGKRVVLSGDKLYIDTGTELEIPFGHPFTGYFHPYPETKYSGLISSIAEDPPIMNWIYVDRDTFEVKFGTRPWAEHNHNGPFDCTRQDRRLTFGGWEGWLAVKEGDFWALYFDRDNDRLVSKVEAGTPVLDIELWRREVRGIPVKVKETVSEEAVNRKETATEEDLKAPDVD
ncbi:uncharacterized protein PAC_15346 [Phialocephala subalpina]|uniref:Uncharacterized protein n=1 Tax=Phialocephala subalpina TaxID=576137 RepID=A0A1L7XKI6_9HELO|nr:uncharacterized protein PAC_15346 [Phialocephala subalpina]